MEYVVLVDENDNEIGQMEKQAAHIDPHLHIVLSLFLYSIRKENYCYSSVPSPNTTPLVCGPTPAAAIPVPERLWKKPLHAV